MEDNWDDEFLKTFGRITVNFGGLEFRLKTFIAQLMVKCSGASGLADMTFQMQLSLLITSELSFPKTAIMLDSLYKHVEPREHTAITELLNKATHAVDERNKIIHSAWFVTRSKELVRLKVTAKKQKKTKPTNLIVQEERTSIDTLIAVDNLLFSANEELDDFMRQRGYGLNFFTTKKP